VVEIIETTEDPSKKRKRTSKPKVIRVTENPEDPCTKKKRKASTKGKQPNKKKKATPTAAEPTPAEPTPAKQYVIHLLPSVFMLV